MKTLRSMILAGALILGALVPVVALTAPPASAQPVEVAVAKAKACQPMIRSAVAHYGDWRFVADVHYRNCVGSSIFDKYVVSILRTNGVTCGDGPGTITEWRVNPNVIGWYNPGNKDLACINGNRLNVTWKPSSGVVINDSAPENERCIGAPVGVGKNNWPDDSFSIPSRCVS